MCKINRCLIISNLMTSELESPMIFILYFKPSLQCIGMLTHTFRFCHCSFPLHSISKLEMLTFYFNILIEPNFLTIEQYIEMLTFDRL